MLVVAAHELNLCRHAINPTPTSTYNTCVSIHSVGIRQVFGQWCLHQVGKVCASMMQTGLPILGPRIAQQFVRDGLGRAPLHHHRVDPKDPAQ